MSGHADLAGWLMSQVSDLRRAKQQSQAAVNTLGDTNEAKVMGDKEAAQLTSFNFMSGCCLDVKEYREAVT